MSCPKPPRVSVALVACIVLAHTTAPAWARVEAGEHISANIDTPWGYKGASGAKPELGWSYELSHPGATYIAIHFTDFDLAPGDFLIVTDPEGRQSYTMDGEGKMGAGTFWAQHIKGDTVLLELMQVNREGGQGFQIDEYVAGYLDIGGDLRAICGTDDKENAICYETSHPVEYDHARAVCRLLSNGSGFCTGWLVSANNHVMTNEHCVSSASEALNTDFDFMAEAPDCATPNCADCFPGTIFSGAVFIQDNADLDYCLMQITSGDPASMFGYLELDNREAIVGEEIYIVGHPGGRAKEMTIFSTHASDPGGIPLVFSITEPPCSGTGFFDVGYYADTEGGSSGSPVLARSSHKVIALHHCANCPNRGVPINLIYPEIEAYLYPGPAGQIALDKGAYSCDDVVAIEMQDGDLGASGTQNVVVTTTGGDSETVALTETGADTAVFGGSIVTSTAAVIIEDGTLQVADGETIAVTYIDADDGSGGTNVVVTDTAVADCVAPQILDVQTTVVQPRAATVSIDADESVQGTVQYGLSCGSFTGVAVGAGFSDPATVNLTGLQDNTTYYYMVVAADEGGNETSDDNGGACYSFTTPEVPNFFTEQFSGDNDLDNQSFFFTPNGSVDFYDACVEPIIELPVDPNGGTVLTVTEDSSVAVTLTGGAQVMLYGVGYSTFYVGDNGYITFTGGDTVFTETFADHFDTPRISMIFDDLSIDNAGTVSWKQLADRAVVTYEGVPEYNTSNSNTYQVELYFNGDITISYLDVAITDGITGLSEGLGVDPDFYETDLSAMGSCGPKPPTASGANLETPVNQALSITLVASDDGLPDPPAALTYIVTSLPTHGELSDPGAGVIGAAPYTIAGGGNLLDYTPDLWYAGADSFMFKVDDGGVPPDAGESSEAVISIDVTTSGTVVAYEFNMDTDPGWTTTGQWAWGVPTGQGGEHGGPDPTSGYTGDNVYGYNLNGDYALNMPQYNLTTTAIDCSGLSDVTLRFQRWLGVEQPAYDHASIQVSSDGLGWTTLWENTATIEETSWSEQEYDISAVADDQSTVYLRWTMGTSDGSWIYCGWNIDDVEIIAAAPYPQILGDLDYDCDVDLADLAALLANYGATSGAAYEQGDIDADGDIDLADLALLLGNYGAPCP